MDPKRAYTFAKFQTLLELLDKIERDLSARLTTGQLNPTTAEGERASLNEAAHLHYASLLELVQGLSTTIARLEDLWNVLPRDSVNLRPRLGSTELEPAYARRLQEHGHKKFLREVTSCLDCLSAVVGHVAQSLLPTDPLWLHQTVHALARAFPPAPKGKRQPICVTVATLPSPRDFPKDEDRSRPEEERRDSDFAFHYLMIYSQAYEHLCSTIRVVKESLGDELAEEISSLSEAADDLPPGRDVFFQQVPYMLGNIPQLASIVTHEIGHYVVRHQDTLREFFRTRAERWVNSNLMVTENQVHSSSNPSINRWFQPFRVTIARDDKGIREVFSKALEKNIEEIFCDCIAVYSIGVIPFLSICQRFDLRFGRNEELDLVVPRHRNDGTANGKPQHLELWLGYYSHPALILRLLAMMKICRRCWQPFNEFCSARGWELFNNGAELFDQLARYFDADGNLLTEAILEDADAAYQQVAVLHKSPPGYGKNYSCMSRGDSFADSVSQSHILFTAVIETMDEVVREVEIINNDTGYRHPEPEYMIGGSNENSVLEAGWATIEDFVKRNLSAVRHGTATGILRSAEYEADLMQTISQLNELLRRPEERQLKFVHLFALTYFVFLSYAHSADRTAYIVANDLVRAYFLQHGTINH